MADLHFPGNKGERCEIMLGTGASVHGTVLGRAGDWLEVSQEQGAPIWVNIEAIIVYLKKPAVDESADWTDVKNRALQDPEVRAEYEAVKAAAKRHAEELQT